MLAEIVFEAAMKQATDAVGFDDFELIGCGFPEPQAECSGDQFRCKNQVCILDYKVCDFSNDCGDFSDEKSCDGNMRDDFESSFGNWVVDHTGGDGWIRQSSLIALTLKTTLQALSKENFCPPPVRRTHCLARASPL